MTQISFNITRILNGSSFFYRNVFLLFIITVIMVYSSDRQEDKVDTLCKDRLESKNVSVKPNVEILKEQPKMFFESHQVKSVNLPNNSEVNISFSKKGFHLKLLNEKEIFYDNNDIFYLSFKNFEKEDIILFIELVENNIPEDKLKNLCIKNINNLFCIIESLNVEYDEFLKKIIKNIINNYINSKKEDKLTNLDDKNFTYRISEKFCNFLQIQVKSLKEICFEEICTEDDNAMLNSIIEKFMLNSEEFNNILDLEYSLKEYFGDKSIRIQCFNLFFAFLIRDDIKSIFLNKLYFENLHLIEVISMFNQTLEHIILKNIEIETNLFYKLNMLKNLKSIYLLDCNKSGNIILNLNCKDIKYKVNIFFNSSLQKHYILNDFFRQENTSEFYKKIILMLNKEILNCSSRSQDNFVQIAGESCLRTYREYKKPFDVQNIRPKINIYNYFKLRIKEETITGYFYNLVSFRFIEFFNYWSNSKSQTFKISNENAFDGVNILKIYAKEISDNDLLIILQLSSLRIMKVRFMKFVQSCETNPFQNIVNESIQDVTFVGFMNDIISRIFEICEICANLKVLRLKGMIKRLENSQNFEKNSKIEYFKLKKKNITVLEIQKVHIRSEIFRIISNYTVQDKLILTNLDYPFLSRFSCDGRVDQVKFLTINSVTFSDSDKQVLEKFINLETVDVKSPVLNGLGFSNLFSSEIDYKIHSLKFSHMDIDEEIVLFLKKLPRLTKLEFFVCQFYQIFVNDFTEAKFPSIEKVYFVFKNDEMKKKDFENFKKLFSSGILKICVLKG